MIRRGTLLAVMLVSTVAVALIVPARAGAADPVSQLQVRAEPREDAWMLVATVTRAGAAQSQAVVEFYQRVDFFGERWVPLGSALTDAAGVASRLYSPTANGEQVFVARHRAEDGLVESEPITISVSSAVPFHPHEEPVLPIVRALAFPVGLLVLVLVWLALVGILLRAVIGIARQPTSREPAAPSARAPSRETDGSDPSPIHPEPSLE